MSLSVLPMKYPADLSANAQQTIPKTNLNGRMTMDMLAPFHCPGIGVCDLHPQAIRSFNWLFAITLWDTGQQLTAVSNGDDYRSYAMQDRLFRSRYAIGGTGGGCKSWDSDNNGVRETWCKRHSSFATAAVPGTSNHGYGLALDVARYDGDSLPEGITVNKLMWAWLSAPNLAPPAYKVGTGSNVESFGLSWEVQSEPWHMRLVTGDSPTRRIRDLEAFFGLTWNPDTGLYN